jgi:KaiC/GvpD/RAD55 family RecA-like ATPase
VTTAEHPIIARLIEAGLYTAPSNGRGLAAAIDLPDAEPGSDAGARYANAALRGECDNVSSAPEGRRNHTLNKAAWKMGRYVAAGYLDGDLVIRHLTAAAESAGLSVGEIHRTVPRAVNDGQANPRQVQLNKDTSADSTTFTVNGTITDDKPDSDTADEVVGDNVDGPGAEGYSHGIDGAAFIFRVEADEPAIWGDGHRVLWAPGEALMVTGPPGVGKTTTVQQLVLARIGLADDFLGFPVQKTASRVLYLAMDRPRQIARSMRRMVDDGDRDVLAERLMVWQGPLPADVAKSPDILLAMCQYYGADTLIVDSVKDAALGLADTERAGMYNRARQRALAADIEVVEISHQVKKGANGTAPKTLADVHGGMELTAGAGSVILIWGQAGDPVVEFHHLKQPAEMIGPLSLMHEHESGRTTIEDRIDAVDVLKAEPWKVWSAPDIASALSDSAGKPNRGQVERVRRKLDKLAGEGLVLRMEQGAAGAFGKTEVRYRWAQGGPDTTWTPS